MNINNNKNKIIILSTTLVFSIFLFFGIFLIYYTEIKIFLFYRLEWKIYKNSNIEFYYTLPERPKNLIMLVPDQRMDKLWNTSNMDTYTGLYLSNYFREKNYIPVVYNRLDAYKDIDYFYSRIELKNQFLSILKEVYNFRNTNYPDIPLIIFAHGDGCTIALMGLLEFNPSEKIILSNCGYENSLLDYYLDFIIETMKISSVEVNIIEQAKSEIKEWKNKENYNIIEKEELFKIQKENIEKKIHPDLIAFRRTLLKFQLMENYEFLRESKKIYFLDLLFSLLQSNSLIYHILSTKDEEMPENIIKNLIHKCERIKNKNYHLIIINNTDHFLFYLENTLNSPMEYLLHRKSPFKSISSELLNIIEKIL